MVDFPNSTKAKKIFLCLFAGTPVGNYQLPQGLGTENDNTIQYSNDRYILAETCCFYYTRFLSIYLHDCIK